MLAYCFVTKAGLISLRPLLLLLLRLFLLPLMVMVVRQLLLLLLCIVAKQVTLKLMLAQQAVSCNRAGSTMIALELKGLYP